MKWFRNLKIGNKLQISFIIVALITAAVGTMGYLSIRTINNSYSKTFTDNTMPIAKIGDIEQRFHRVRLNARDLIDAEDADEIQKNIEKIKEHSKVASEDIDYCEKYISDEKEKEIMRKFETYRAKYRNNLNQVFKLAEENRDAEAKLLMNGEMYKNAMGYQNALEEWKQNNIEQAKSVSYQNNMNAERSSAFIFLLVIIGSIVAVGFGFFIANLIKKPVYKLLRMAEELQKGHVDARADIGTNDEIGTAGKVLDTFAYQLEQFTDAMHKTAAGDATISVPVYDSKDRIAPALNKLTATLRELIEETNSLTFAAKEGDLEKRGNESKFEGGYKQIISGINKTLETIVGEIIEANVVLRAIMAGDLTVRVNGNKNGLYKDYQEVINNVADSLTNVIAEVTQAVKATASSAAEISSSTEEMAAGAEEQSQQATEVAGAVEQMTKTIIETTQNAVSASDASKQYGDIAKEGGNVVDETIQGINKIAAVVRTASDTVNKLGNSSKEIGEIIEVIDDIADQTNLLALNAAIEAARAGEQGRGFAVVADEVRKLAERTTKATKEIASMIKQIQIDTDGAVISISEGNQEVENGKLSADKAGIALNKIIKGAQNVVDIISQVAAASEEQSSASEQISKNIEAISSVTQQSAAGIQQVAGSAGDLSRLTENLENLISRFKIDFSGNNTSQNSGISEMSKKEALMLN